MKILHLRSSGGFYGAERVILGLVQQLNGLGCENHVVCIKNSKNPHVELIDKAAEAGIMAGSVECKGVFDRRTVKDIKAYILDHGIQILHCHDYKATVFGLLASRGLRLKRIATNHLWDKINFKLWVYERMEGVLYNFFDRVVCVSDPIAKTVRPFVLNKKKVQVIPNGIDVKNFSVERKAQSVEEKPDFMIGIVGRLVPQKGHRVFINVMKKLHDEFPNLKCIFVGEGFERENLESLIQNAGLTQTIKIVGEQPDMPSVYAALDMLVMPSLEEGLPMVLLEAMSAGLPVVATRVGAIPSVVENGINGMLVDPNDSDGLYLAIKDVLSNPEKMNQFSAAAKRTVELQYSSGVMASKYLDVYRNL